MSAKTYPVMTQYGPGEVEAHMVDEQGRPTGKLLVLVPRETMNLNWRERFKSKWPRVQVWESECVREAAKEAKR